MAARAAVLTPPPHGTPGQGPGFLFDPRGTARYEYRGKVAIYVNNRLEGNALSTIEAMVAQAFPTSEPPMP